MKNKNIKIIKYILIFIIVLIIMTNIFKNNLFNCILSTIIIAFYFGIVLQSNDIVNPFIFLIIATGLGTLDIIVVALGLRNVREYIPPIYYTKALFIIVIWYILFCIGYYLARKLELKNKVIKSKNKLETKNRVTIFVIFIIYMGAFFTAFKISGGSISSMIIGMQTRVSTYMNKGYLFNFVAIGGMLPVLLYNYNKKNLSYISIIVVLFSQLLLGGRTTAIITSIMPFVVYYNYRVKKIKLKRIIFLVIPLMILMVIWGQLRIGGEVKIDSMNSIDYLTYLTGSKGYGRSFTYSLMAIDNNIIKYQGISMLINIFFAFIPRAIWPSKPAIDEGGIIGRLLFGNNSTGQPIGPFGFAYISFGWIGIIVSGVLTGYICKKVYDNLIKKDNTFYYIIYSYIGTGLIQVFNTSPLMDIIIYSIMITIIKQINDKFKIISL